MTLLRLRDLTVLRGERRVVDAVTLDIGAGECVGLIGPNGAGKTTLMRAALGLERHRGESGLAALAPAALARAAAFLPQAREIAWPLTVEALVALGRIPHLPPGARLRPEDAAVVDRAIGRLGLQGFRGRLSTELSGGEQARVLIARALAQETPLLIADEPTAGLDPAHQIAAMRVFSDLAAEGRSALVSLHDLGLALRWCTRLVMMDRGRVVADGAPRDVLTPTLLREVFGVAAWIAETPLGPVLQPMELRGSPPG
ncbi:ABC transporter ATP-binding protein [Pikeienuella sp. HZG-20]|uniref:ABC transporter ATP-binding protein n=1 Tax=Paludibacillus litoralis TaxID=3133267 RepID=UPI0030EE3535